MTARPCGDAGQAFPIYITVVAGLLFLAFAYFAVAQAADRRSGAQTAADAAALAASQDARDQLREGLLDSLLNPEAWDGLVNGQGVEFETACAEAQSFAARNDADLVDPGCERVDDGFTVTVETRGTVGDSIVPGTEKKHAQATATAVIEPRCRVKPDHSDDDKPAKGKGKGTEKPRLELDCDDQDWVIDPENGDPPPDPADLYSVHLKD
ncbi:pilus assembly protein TadG-related protein [Streptomyces sp. 8N706]|uniref:pilus assembly protein TadG-related protein n=1 Tax=Streptomyces sp. 8N706 TaxID=3457416 RepID=UPI003FD173A7